MWKVKNLSTNKRFRKFYFINFKYWFFCVDSEKHSLHKFAVKTHRNKFPRDKLYLICILLKLITQKNYYPRPEMSLLK